MLYHATSRTQRTIALSSGEAETYAATSGGCDAVLLKECLCYLFPGEELAVKLFIDSSACRAILQRQGVGKVRHLSTRCLWMQQFCKRGVCSIYLFGTKSNVSDIGRKCHPRPRMLFLMFLLGVYDQATSQRVGSETYERLTAENFVADSINHLSSSGLDTKASKTLLNSPGKRLEPSGGCFGIYLSFFYVPSGDVSLHGSGGGIWHDHNMACASCLEA